MGSIKCNPGMLETYEMFYLVKVLTDKRSGIIHFQNSTRRMISVNEGRK
jgi:hypothetical protein